MTPLEFLREEYENVQRALRDTLRFEYGPEQSGDYYNECDARLADIGVAISRLAETQTDKIQEYLVQLWNVATFVSLIERSRLGEFSWPFADELRRISKILFTENSLTGDPLPPIIHVVAEGSGYRIVYEPQVPVASSRRRFLVVAFPRSLKHHILLHTLFGHEVGHTALHTTNVGGILQREVLAGLLDSSPLKDVTTMNTWLNATVAPQDLKKELSDYKVRAGRAFEFTEYHRVCWLEELICDFFGLLLFGPAFFAAHRAYLQPIHPHPYSINTSEATHPPFAVRYKMLSQTLRLKGWHTPTTNSSDGTINDAETATLSFLLDDPYDQWAKMFDDAGLGRAVAGVNNFFASYHGIGYSPLNASDLAKLVSQLMKGLPPILADIDTDGKPLLTKVEMSQMLYAGWVYWLGRQHLGSAVPLDFFTTNRLCDHALLQQRAINFILSPESK